MQRSQTMKLHRISVIRSRSFLNGRFLICPMTSRLQLYKNRELRRGHKHCGTVPANSSDSTNVETKPFPNNERTLGRGQQKDDRRITRQLHAAELIRIQEAMKTATALPPFVIYGWLWSLISFWDGKQARSKTGSSLFAIECSKTSNIQDDDQSLLLRNGSHPSSNTRHNHKILFGMYWFIVIGRT